MFIKFAHLRALFLKVAFRQIRSVFRDSRGIAALEFALVLPVAFASLFSVIEVARYHYIDSKLQEVVRVVARDHQTVGNDDERTALTASKVQADFATYIAGYFGTELSLDDLVLNISVYDDVANYVDGNAVIGTDVVGATSQLVVYSVTYNWHAITPYLDTLLSNDIKTLTVTKVIQNEP
ncbi:MAG: pilus assembly protein [Sneathiella sp.]|nr:pilus assembly protein [Sneathiella sp.]